MLAPLPKKLPWHRRTNQKNGEWRKKVVPMFFSWCLEHTTLFCWAVVIPEHLCYSLCSVLVAWSYWCKCLAKVCALRKYCACWFLCPPKWSTATLIFGAPSWDVFFVEQQLRDVCGASVYFNSSNCSEEIRVCRNLRVCMIIQPSAVWKYHRIVSIIIHYIYEGAFGAKCQRLNFVICGVETFAK